MRLVNLAVPHTGASGAEGFSFKSSLLEEHPFSEYEHGDYYGLDSIEHQWLPFLNQNRYNFEILLGRDIDSYERFEELLNKCHELDLKCYLADGVAKEHELIERGVALDWVKVNPAIYVFLLERGSPDHVLGYVNLMPVKAATYDAILRGEQDDSKIRDFDIVPYQQGGDLQLYVMSIVIDPVARNVRDGAFQGAFEHLMQAAINQLIDLVRECQIRVTKIAAVGWTSEGKRLCELFGMTESAAQDQQGRPIYELRAENFSRRGRALFALRRLADAQSY